MLRTIFDEPDGLAAGALAETYQWMDQFASRMQKLILDGHDKDFKLRKYEIWTLGLRSSLNELEQSHYAASKLRERILSTSVQQMSEEEKANYDRYVYFDKNGFIRVFSTLDKLGTFLNEYLDMKTEQIKNHFSYFTVLRNMRERKAYPDLTWKLNAVKEHYREPTTRLRKRRNTEIHYMNSEMQDDLIQSQRMYGEETKLENIAQQTSDLTQCLYLVIESLRLVYQYACSQMKEQQV